MGSSQLLKWIHFGRSMTSLPPGDLRLWQALEKSVPRFVCRQLKVVCLEWDQEILANQSPSLEQWNDWMCLEGVTSVALSLGVSESLCLQKRTRGLQADALATLVRECFDQKGFVAPKSIWVADQFEFDLPEGADINLAYDALNAIVSLGAKSGVYEPLLEEIRVLKKGDPVEWDRLEHLPSSENLFKETFEHMACDRGKSPFRTRYRISEMRPRVPPEVQERDSLYERQNTSLIADSQDRYRKKAPLHFLMAVPKNMHPATLMDQFKNAIDLMSALYDRPKGILALRETVAHTTLIDYLSPLPLPLQNLSEQPNDKCRLYALGPWDSRNTLVERRMEWFFEKYSDLIVGNYEVLDGSEDWWQRVAQIGRQHGGWAMTEHSLKALIEKTQSRTPTQELVLFWSDKDASQIAQMIGELGLSIQGLGAPVRDSKFSVVKNHSNQILFSKVISAQGDSLDLPERVQANWNYPELKSPTYGFEKVSIYPDQYLTKILNQGIRGLIYRRTAWEQHTGAQFRDVTMRRLESTPLQFLRWTDGQNTWADSMASVPGFSTVDPRMAGQVALEAAIRGLIAKGVDPKSAMRGELWLSRPDRESSGDQFQEHEAAFILALEGAYQGAQEMGVSLSEVNIPGVPSKSRSYLQEVFVRMQGRVESDIQPIFPGFRMTGEVLYVIGPKPAFMDIGSKVLAHTRVYSNHVSRIHWPSQVELYDLLHKCIRDRLVTVVRPVLSGGIAESLAEAAFWSGIGVQMRPNIPIVEMFSSAPGRFLVGVLPQDSKKFESMIKPEMLTHVGTSSGEKLYGLTISSLLEERLKI